MAPLAESLFVLEIPAIYASEFETGYHTLAVKILSRPLSDIGLVTHQEGHFNWCGVYIQNKEEK